MPLPSLHHIGFVVASIEAQVRGFVAVLGASWNGQIVEDPLQKVKVTFLAPAGGGAQLELVEPASADSPVSAFLARGGGLHHLCYEVDDLEAHLEAMRAQRATITRKPRPAVAFGGRRIAWVYSAERLLLEFLERANGTHRTMA
jgi:methylmalonyl-CoA/ethylmalonyl-CoA epimerase